MKNLMFLLLTAPLFAQMTAEQRAADFRYLASQYSKQYAPYEWKRELFGFDALVIGPWIDRVQAAKNDLEFYEICVEYIASLHDTHVGYSIPSNFSASLGFTTDIFDGKVLIDSINRTRLPASRYPFDIGDEIVSVDGVEAETLVRSLMRYAPQGNERSSRRQAAARITTRPQSRVPRAVELGESAFVTARRMTGAVESYTVPWVKTGTPVHVGPVPSPKSVVRRNLAEEEQLPDYMAPWLEVQHSAVNTPEGVLNYGSRTPIFALPANFQQRLGRVASDFFFSGTYVFDGLRIGYIRIPNYGSLAASVQQQFDTEIAYFQQNTDGLVVDEMRNNGGFLCFGENIATRLIPYRFRATGYELRVSWSRVNGFYNSMMNARAQNAEQWVIDLYESMFNAVYQAYTENRGRTGSISLCSISLDRDPATNAQGQVAAYTKPMIMLVDEFSTSTADSVPAMIQDAKRGLIVGYRTNGAGGTNITVEVGAYSEASAGMTLGLMTRAEQRVTPGYPESHYLENVGVHPDVELDYMTRDNLLQRGQPFVNAFSRILAEQVRKGQ